MVGTVDPGEIDVIVAHRVFESAAVIGIPGEIQHAVLLQLFQSLRLVGAFHKPHIRRGGSRIDFQRFVETVLRRRKAAVRKKDLGAFYQRRFRRDTGDFDNDPVPRVFRAAVRAVIVSGIV